MDKVTHIKNGEELIHYEGCFSDLALCGHDMVGDDIYGDSWGLAVPTKKRVNCPDCIRIVRYVRGLD